VIKVVFPFDTDCNASDGTDEANCHCPRRPFSASLAEYLAIHKRLFEGTYDFAGKIRDYI